MHIPSLLSFDALAELLLLVLILSTALLSLLSQNHKLMVMITVAGLIGIMAAIGVSTGVADDSLNPLSSLNTVLAEHFVTNRMTQDIKLFTLMVCLILVIDNHGDNHDNNHDNPRRHSKQFVQYLLLIQLAQLALMILASAGSLLTAYLSMELLTLATWGLMASSIANHQSSSAKGDILVRFFVTNALASCALLLGISFIYGGTGSILFSDIYFNDGAQQEPSLFVRLGMIFALSAVLFKLGIAPLHRWLPAMFQSMPIAFNRYIDSLYKIAALLLIYHLLASTLYEHNFQPVLLVLGILSMIIGHSSMIAETNISRLLAHSSIAQMGFLLLGIATNSSLGSSSALVYILLFVLISLATMTLLMFMQRQDKPTSTLAECRRLCQNQPLFALLLGLLMFTLAGMPATPLFYAKLMVLKSLVAAELTWIAVFAVLVSLIGSYAYIRLIGYCCLPNIVFRPSSEPSIASHTLHRQSLSKPIGMVLIIHIALILLIGIYPDWLIDWSQQLIAKN